MLILIDIFAVNVAGELIYQLTNVLMKKKEERETDRNEIELFLTEKPPENQEEKIKGWKKVLAHFEYDKDMIIDVLVLRWYLKLFGDEAGFYKHYKAYQTLSCDELITILLDHEEELIEKFYDEIEQEIDQEEK